MPEYLPTILIIAVLAVICVAAVLSIIKRANKGCCGAGGDIEEKIVKDASDFTHVYRVKIGGMHCDKCASRIATAFNRQDGVFAEVSWKAGEALVRSKEPLPELIIRQTVMGLDYTVESVAAE